MEQNKHEAVRTVARLSRIFEKQLADQAMTLPQYRLLAFLSNGESAASALADWLAVSRPSLTSLVDGLVEKGWVARQHSPDDRRRVLHQLTDAGRARLADASDALVDRLDGLLEHLDAAESARVLEGFATLQTAMQRAKEAVTSA